MRIRNKNETRDNIPKLKKKKNKTHHTHPFTTDYLQEENRKYIAQICKARNHTSYFQQAPQAENLM